MQGERLINGAIKKAPQLQVDSVFQWQTLAA